MDTRQFKIATDHLKINLSCCGLDIEEQSESFQRVERWGTILWTWHPRPTTPSVFASCTLQDTFLSESGGITVLLMQTLWPSSTLKVFSRYWIWTILVCEMYEFLWNVMSKGGMEIWHSIVRVHSIVRDWSPPGERHVIPYYYAITLWRSVSWTTFVALLGYDESGLVDDIWECC